MNKRLSLSLIVFACFLLKQGVAQDILIIKAKYSGRINTMTDFFQDDKFRPVFALQKEIVITNLTEYDHFTARLPSMEPLNTKGDDHLNGDPLLKKPLIDFTNQMIVAVVCFDTMYLSPDITRVMKLNDSVIVYSSDPDLKTMEGYQENGLGTYCAAVIPKTNLKVIFTKEHPITIQQTNAENSSSAADLK